MGSIVSTLTLSGIMTDAASVSSEFGTVIGIVIGLAVGVFVVKFVIAQLKRARG